MTAEDLAVRFHETYERLAPSFGYETRKETRAFDPTTPNGRLMIAVCAELIPLFPTESGSGWRPISEAPTDGTPIWAYQPNGTPHGAQYVAWMDDHIDCGPCWFDEQDSEPEPTHWRPLPPPPEPPTDYDPGAFEEPLV